MLATLSWPTVLGTFLTPCRQLALNDAIMRHLSGPTLVQPTVIVALALGSLYASFICFAQSVRLYVHTVSAAH
jgi:urea transporter